jgi:hypothetical protein
MGFARFVARMKSMLRQRVRSSSLKEPPWRHLSSVANVSGQWFRTERHRESGESGES